MSPAFLKRHFGFDRSERLPSWSAHRDLTAYLPRSSFGPSSRGSSGKGGALPRRPPLRTVLAGFLAHGSSKPLGQGGLQLQCCAPARACLEGAVAGGMYQGCGSLGVPHAILPEEVAFRPCPSGGRVARRRRGQPRRAALATGPTRRGACWTGGGGGSGWGGGRRTVRPG